MKARFVFKKKVKKLISHPLILHLKYKEAAKEALEKYADTFVAKALQLKKK